MNNGHTRLKKLNYTFIKPSERDFVPENPNKIVATFTQVCTFPTTEGKYQVRQYKSNNNDEFVSIKDYELTKDQVVKFTNETKRNQYKCYSTNSLQYVSYPNLNDIQVAKSQIIGFENSYSGFAPAGL